MTDQELISTLQELVDALERQRVSALAAVRAGRAVDSFILDELRDDLGDDVVDALMEANMAATNEARKRRTS